MDIVFDAISFVMEIPTDTPGGSPDSAEFENAVYLSIPNQSSGGGEFVSVS
jgi:hypothetical protein